MISTNNKDINFDSSKIQSVNLNLLNGQVEILLRALELYGYNLEYMLNSTDSSNKTKDDKLAMLKYTYEQILATQAEQVNGKANGKANNNDNVPNFGKLILKNNNNNSDLNIVNF